MLRASRLLAASAPATSLPTALADASRLVNPTSIMVGLSGGLDSSLLLTLLCGLRTSGELTLPLRAIHVNHGLQEAADKWQLHCETLCSQHGVNLTVCVVDCSLNSAGATTERAVGEPAVVSEEAARRARYAAFEGALDAGEWLALGHHQDDQLETLLLRLARGSGVDGLAGMPSARVLGAGAHSYAPGLRSPGNRLRMWRARGGSLLSRILRIKTRTMTAIFSELGCCP